MERLDRAAWRKSSYSGTSGNNCVEVAKSAGAVIVRDTTNAGGGVLSVPAEAWKTFTDTLR